jgi:hypothetical protein
MTPQRRQEDTLAFWGKIIGIITGLFVIMSVATAKMIDPYIDAKIECKTKYMELLLRTMATDEQKIMTDREYERWVRNKQ